jgi:hypothetical protein
MARIRWYLLDEPREFVSADRYLKQTGASMSTCGESLDSLTGLPSFTTGRIPLSAGLAFTFTYCLLAGCVKNVLFLL